MKKALITGASGDIGFAIAEKLASNGIDLVLQYNHSDFSDKENFLKSKYNVNIKAYRSDFTKLSEIFKFADLISSENNNIDIIINNAGISIYGLFQDMSEDDFENIINVNLQAPMIITNKLINQMIHAKSGNIVNISSVWGETGAACEVLYSATKSGLIGFTKSLAKEVALSGIRVNCVAPGVIDTKMLSVFNSDDIRVLKEEIPLNRLGKAEEVADAVFFLISENSSYITGEVLKVNGGFNI